MSPLSPLGSNDNRNFINNKIQAWIHTDRSAVTDSPEKEINTLKNALDRKNITEALSLISSDKFDFQALNHKQKFSILKQTLDLKNLDLLKAMLKKGADFTLTNDYQQTLLHHAAASLNKEAYTFLLDQGLNPKQQDTFKQTPLKTLIKEYFTSTNKPFTVKELFKIVPLKDLERSMSEMSKSDDKYFKEITMNVIKEQDSESLKSIYDIYTASYTPFAQLFEDDTQHILKISDFIKIAPDILKQASTYDQQVYLHKAYKHNDFNSINTLVKDYNFSLNIKANLTDDEDRSFIEQCLESGKIKEIIEIIKENQLKINQDPKNPDLRVETIFNLFEYHGAELASVLLKAGIDPDSSLRSTDSTLLIDAIDNKKTDLIDLLIENGANVNLATNHAGYTPLLHAVKTSNPEVVDKLLKAGSDPNKTDNADNSALTDAASLNSHEIIKLLIDHGANVKHKIGVLDPLNILIKEGLKPFNQDGFSFMNFDLSRSFNDPAMQERYLKYKDNQLKSARLLIEADADINSEDYYGNSNLMLAAQLDNKEIFNLLLDSHADIHHRNTQKSNIIHTIVNAVADLGRTPINTGAAIHDPNYYLERLISKGADLNSIDFIQQTPFIAALQGHSASAVNALLDQGVDLRAQDFKYLTYLDKFSKPAYKEDIYDRIVNKFVEDFEQTGKQIPAKIRKFFNMRIMDKLIAASNSSIKQENPLKALIQAGFTNKDLDLDLARVLKTRFINLTNFLADSGSTELTSLPNDELVEIYNLAFKQGNLKLIQKVVDRSDFVNHYQRPETLDKTVYYQALKQIPIKLYNLADRITEQENYNKSASLSNQRAAFPNQHRVNYLKDLIVSVQEPVLDKHGEIIMPNGVDDIQGNNLLHTAVKLGDVDVLRKLIGSGVNLKATNNNQQTALIIAAKERPEMLSTLLRYSDKFSSILDQQDALGNTAAHYLAEQLDKTGISNRYYKLNLLGLLQLEKAGASFKVANNKGQGVADTLNDHLELLIPENHSKLASLKYAKNINLSNPDSLAEISINSIQKRNILNNTAKPNPEKLYEIFDEYSLSLRQFYLDKHESIDIKKLTENIKTSLDRTNRDDPANNELVNLYENLLKTSINTKIDFNKVSDLIEAVLIEQAKKVNRNMLKTVLAQAASSHNHRVLNYLLAEGLDPDQTNLSGKPILENLISDQNKRQDVAGIKICLELLKSYGADFSVKNNDGADFTKALSEEYTSYNQEINDYFLDILHGSAKLEAIKTSSTFLEGHKST
jgi:ankyrin repeat protein